MSPVRTPVASGRKLSPFEQLPTEIVQLIFEFSNNISLPLSSHVFATKLSAESIYLRFAVETLYEDECKEPGDKSSTVSQMLQCRWLSMRILLAALQQCYDKAKHRYDVNCKETLEETHEYVLPDLPPTLKDPQRRLPNQSYYHLHSPVQLPQKLLRGPWTEEKTSFLLCLIWQGVGIDWNMSSRGEVATQGLQEAIQEGNRKAVASLVCSVVGVVPSAANIKSAIMDRGCDPVIVYHLLEAALRARMRAKYNSEQMTTDFNFRDPSVWSWASRLKASGESAGYMPGYMKGGYMKGGWLQNILHHCEDNLTHESVFDAEDFASMCTGDETSEWRHWSTYMARTELIHVPEWPEE